MSTKLFVLLMLLPLQVLANGWTGIAAFVGQQDSDWIQASTLKLANIDFYGLRIEEKTEAELRVGARAGGFDLRLVDANSETNAEKYTGQFITLYLRWPVTLTDNLRFHSTVRYQINLGTKTADLDGTEINWNTVSLDLGLGLQLGNLSIRPFVRLQTIDGDITSTEQTRIFKHSDTNNQGLTLDYFVEQYAYVRLQAITGNDTSMMLSFAREF